MQTTSTPHTATDDIATAAYYHWVNAGKPAGRDQEFWLKAEAEAKGNGQAARPQPAGTRPKSRAKAASKR